MEVEAEASGAAAAGRAAEDVALDVMGGMQEEVVAEKEKALSGTAAVAALAISTASTTGVGDTATVAKLTTKLTTVEDTAAQDSDASSDIIQNLYSDEEKEEKLEATTMADAMAGMNELNKIHADHAKPLTPVL